MQFPRERQPLQVCALKVSLRSCDVFARSLCAFERRAMLFGCNNDNDNSNDNRNCKTYSNFDAANAPERFCMQKRPAKAPTSTPKRSRVGRKTGGGGGGKSHCNCNVLARRPNDTKEGENSGDTQRVACLMLFAGPSNERACLSFVCKLSID